jgi:predicted DNA-binding protein (UPF0278 family)
MVGPKDQIRFLGYSRMAGMNPTVMLENVQRYKNKKLSDFTDPIYFSNIHSLIAQLDVSNAINPRATTWTQYHTKDSINNWITSATMTRLINATLTNQSNRWRRVAESFDWHIISSINPDGYAYTNQVLYL